MNSLQIEVLKIYGVKSFEISHLKNNKMNKIGRKRRKFIKLLLSASICKGSDLLPLANNEKVNELRKQKHILVLKGLPK